MSLQVLDASRRKSRRRFSVTAWAWVGLLPILTASCESTSSTGTPPSDGGQSDGGECKDPPCTPAATCSDGLKNALETDVDCGGGSCPACVPSRSCQSARDCDSGYCLNGTCGSPACGVQNLVVMVGQQGAHGYGQLLWPHPDSYAGRASEQLPVAFMQDKAARGAVGQSFGGTLRGTVDYTSPPAQAASGALLAPWSAGQRFQLVYGIDNQAVGGFRSTNAMSRALDTTFYGSDTVPNNATLPASKKFIVASRETPWLGKYGLAKSMTILDGGVIRPSYINGAHNVWINYSQQRTLMAAAAVEQLARKAPVPVVIVPGNLQVYVAPSLIPFYGTNLPAKAPTPLLADSAAKLAAAVETQTGVAATDLLPTSADQVRYGYTGTVTKLTDMRDRMIVAAKLLQRGLTAQISIGYFNDGPSSTLFSTTGNGGFNASSAATAQSNFYNAFMDDLAAPDPACPQRTLADNTVIILVGDTPQDGVCRDWADFSSPSGQQNRMWVMSNGFLKTGAFGGERAAFPGQCAASADYGTGEGGLYDLTTGDLLPFAAGTSLTGGQDLRVQYGETAAAAVLYSVFRGSLPLVSKYYSGPAFPALLSAKPPK